MYEELVLDTASKSDYLHNEWLQMKLLPARAKCICSKRVLAG